jgi:hypothetical protein
MSSWEEIQAAAKDRAKWQMIIVALCPERGLEVCS